MSAAIIRALNDALRSTMTGGRVMMTAGVDALPSDVKAVVIRRVAMFSAFTPENDPHGEHDFGSFELTGRRFFFKLDYFDPTMTFGSEDPSDPAKTTRVLTITDGGRKAEAALNQAKADLAAVVASRELARTMKAWPGGASEDRGLACSYSGQDDEPEPPRQAAGKLAHSEVDRRPPTSRYE